MGRFINSFCLCAAVLFLNAAEAQEKLPRVVFNKKLFDFGETIQGRTIRHVFTFKNIGQAPLKIYKVDPSCVCALLKKPSESIAPGQSGELEVAFETGSKVGFQTIHIVVYSNDPAQNDRGRKVTVLRLRGEIINLYKISPPILSLGRITKGYKGRPRVVKIGAKGTRTFKILSLLKSSEYLDVKWQESAQKGYDLTVSLKADAPIGQLSVDLVFQTDMKRQAKIRIPVFASVATLYETSPTIILDRTKAGQSVSIPIFRYQGKGLEILGIDYDRKRFHMAMKVVRPGSQVELLLTVREDSPVGPFAGKMIIRMASKSQPWIEIPVLGNVWGVLQYEPKAIFLEKPVKKGALLAKVEVLGAQNDSKNVLGAELIGGPAKARLEFKGKRCFIIVEADKDAQSSDFQKAHVIVKTALKGQAVIKIPFLTGN